MLSAGTEGRNPGSAALDQMSAVEIVDLMNDEEERALEAVRAAAPALAVGAEKIAEIFKNGGRVFFLGAGTSGRLAVQEVAELPPTFGVPADRFIALIASGPTGGPAAVTTSEDDAEAALSALTGAGCCPADGVIGISASGSTPFVVAGIRHAASLGAWTCGVANNPDTPLLRAASLDVLLATGPEVVTGSTRLKAGTAQKLALNRLTTAALVRAGRVISNYMVEVRPTTDKLRDRCIRIVAELTGLDSAGATSLLQRSDWNIRDALATTSHKGS